MTVGPCERYSMIASPMETQSDQMSTNAYSKAAHCKIRKVISTRLGYLSYIRYLSPTVTVDTFRTNRKYGHCPSMYIM